jgi:acylphosphatase
MAIARKLRLTGLVQGVFFRAWTRDEARRLGVKGWVRNCDDGSVEAHVEGDEASVQKLIERMRDGSPGARVDDMQIDEVNPKDFDRFEVRQ